MVTYGLPVVYTLNINLIKITGRIGAFYERDGKDPE
jgi:hypothetical protein